MDVGSGPWLTHVDDLSGRINESLSLEATVLGQRAAELRTDAIKLARQRAFLRGERRRARMDEESLRQDKAEYEQVKKDDWMPRHHLPLPAARRVRLNVGGQVFEVAEAVLRRDPHSLLAALCDDECPLKTDDDGVIYVDRDWWVFRTVLKFLRDGVVPEDRPLLTQLYREAGFWRCETLKHAIEQTQLCLYRKEYETDKNGNLIEKPAPEKLRASFTQAVDWWQVRADANKEAATKATPKPAAVPSGPAKDWWTGSEYKGRRYSTVSVAPNKVVTAPTEPDAAATTKSTWSYRTSTW